MHPARTGPIPLARDRSALFRSRHRVGEQVIGTVVEEQGAGLAWVRIDDQVLLAAMSTRAEPGSRLDFRILSLFPDIVLQDLRTVDGSDPSGPELLHRFRTGRDRFEVDLRHRPWPSRHQPGPGRFGPRQRQFIMALDGDPALAGAFRQVSAALNRLNLWLGDRGPGRAVYWPWLFPGTWRQEGLARRPLTGPRPRTLIDILYSLETAEWGGVRIHCFGCLRDLSYRVDLERPECSPLVGAWLDRLAQGFPGPPPRCLSTSPLKPGQGLDVLGGLLDPATALTHDFSLRI